MSLHLPTSLPVASNKLLQITDPDDDYERKARSAANVPIPLETLLIEIATAALLEFDGDADEPEVAVVGDA
jgi:hypothetical protein